MTHHLLLNIRSKLTIINVTRYDDGSYSCHVSNPVSSANSDPVHLSVINNGNKEEYANILDRVQITTNEENFTLTIVNVTRNDLGSYRCHVSNPGSSIISDPVNISVIYGPDNVTIEVYPFKEYYEKGSDIYLLCSADSSPSAEYQWFLNGSQLTSNGPLLQLINIQMNQSGNYSCQAFNSETLTYKISQPLFVFICGRYKNVFNSSTSVLH
uniref:Ig-like domain-containing protein n=1 Tax=Poecilia reticulata TaxID=8081 RepID=A0A3P9NWN7_POERE